MNIGFFTDAYAPQINGVAISLAALTDALRARGNRVKIIAPLYTNYKDANSDIVRLFAVRILKNPDIRFALPFVSEGFYRAVKTSYDIIHGFGPGPITLLGLLVARLKKIPFVYSYNTRWDQLTHYFLRGKIITPSLVKRLNTFFCNSCDYIVAPTQTVKEELQTMGITKPIAVLANGIDLVKFAKEQPGFLYHQLNLSKDIKIILYTGRLSKEKSVDVLLQMVKKVFDKVPNAMFILVGDGPAKKELKKLTRSLDIESQVNFYGEVSPDDMPKVYKDATVFVFASQLETQGLVVAEALASGVPVVAKKDDVFKDIMQDGVNGFMVTSINDFATRVITLLTNEKSRKQMSKQALVLIKPLSLETNAAQFEDFYHQITSA